MKHSRLLASAVRMAVMVLVTLLVPTILGLLLDVRLGVSPWGFLVALALGAPLAAFFIVRFTFDAYRRIEKSHISASSDSSTPLVKEDERA